MNQAVENLTFHTSQKITFNSFANNLAILKKRRRKKS